MKLFSDRIHFVEQSARGMISGTLLGGLCLVLMIFAQIFTNVWGYVEPVSPWFRNKFWLPYLLMAGGISLIVGWKKGTKIKRSEKVESLRGWVVIPVVLFLGTVVSGIFTTGINAPDPDSDSIVVMTYNIQQANDLFGERSYREQLALIKEVSPDILALQESDSTRVSLNNNDYVRFFSGKMGYFSYFGPTTVTGTYGTAILSRFPLINPRTIFSFSSQDEIGTAVAEIVVDRKTITIYNVHPAGSDEAKMAFAEAVVNDALGRSNVIILGDFNLRDYEKAYQLIDSHYTNAWTDTYPTKIGPDGTDMSGDNRIDHIFYSPNLDTRNPVYLLPPDSATDHPAHWAEIVW